MQLRDRADAGRRLAELLSDYARRSDVIVLGLPRGGVMVAYEVATALRAPLDVFTVRKLGVPGREELAMGAVASGDVVVLNQAVIRGLAVPPEIVEQVIAAKKEELHGRERAYRKDRAALDVRGKRAILIDDGLATGASMSAAVAGLERHRPAEIVVAVPVAAAEAAGQLRRMVDRFLCPAIPEPFYGVGQWYEDFRQMTDAEVTDLLARASHHFAAGPPPP
jgi:predicted phosphoribosyltransferase